MRIYKQNWTDKEGKKRTAERWTLEIPDHRGKGRRFVGFKDKRLTETLGQKIEQLVRCKKLNEPLPVELAKWLEACPQTMKKHLLKIGLLNAQETQAGKPLTALLAEFIESRKIRGCGAAYIADLKTRLSSLFKKQNLRYWTDVDSQKIEKYLAEIKDKGRAPRTVNSYLEHFKVFHNWMLDRELIVRPLPGLRNLKKLDERLDRRKIRRALTIGELRALLQAAKTRPLHEATKINRGLSKGNPGARLKSETIDKLRLLGIERALIYQVAFYTGLRRKELKSIPVKDVLLNCPAPRIVLKSENEKNRNGSELPLRKTLAAEIKDFIKQKGLAPKDKLFTIPKLRTFKDDLGFAGIALKDEDGRSIDFHGLRVSYATHLSKSGVDPRTAQACLRHSDIRLTMQVYTDPTLLNVVGAIDKLPDISIDQRKEKTA